jgi:hypothetical protein
LDAATSFRMIQARLAFKKNFTRFQDAWVDGRVPHSRAEVKMLSYPISKSILRHSGRDADRLPIWLCASVVGALSALLWAGIGTLAVQLL